MTALRKTTEDLPCDASFEPNVRSGSILSPLDPGAPPEDLGAPPSPARELQQRLEQAALRSFYTPAVTADQVPSWGRRQRLAIIIAAALSGWVAFVGVGYGLFA